MLCFTAPAGGGSRAHAVVVPPAGGGNVLSVAPCHQHMLARSQASLSLSLAFISANHCVLPLEVKRANGATLLPFHPQPRAPEGTLAPLRPSAPPCSSSSNCYHCSVLMGGVPEGVCEEAGSVA